LTRVNSGVILETGVDTLFVIGTAGHVDHGKSTLVHALTGIDPTGCGRKAREMTIELGFAWFTLRAVLKSA